MAVRGGVWLNCVDNMPVIVWYFVNLCFYFIGRLAFQVFYSRITKLK